MERQKFEEVLRVAGACGMCGYGRRLGSGDDRVALNTETGLHAVVPTIEFPGGGAIRPTAVESVQSDGPVLSPSDIDALKNQIRTLLKGPVA